MAKAAGMMKLDAICARLKDGLKKGQSTLDDITNDISSSKQSEDDTSQPSGDVVMDLTAETNNNQLKNDLGEKPQDGGEEEDKEESNAGLEEGALLGRRNRRKILKPRCMVQYANDKDDEKVDEDEEIPDEKDSSAVLDLSCSSSKHSPGKTPSPAPADDNYCIDDLGVMDLSTSKDKVSESPASEAEKPLTSVHPKKDTEKAKVQTLVSGPFLRGFQPAVNPVEVSSMKNYAENTMKELLSMYGFNDEAEDQGIVRGVPLRNFTPVAILERDDADSMGGTVETSRDARDEEDTMNSSLAFEDSNQSSEFNPKASDLSNSPQSSLGSKNSKTSASNFASSAAYVNACFDPSLGPKLVAAAAKNSGSKLLPDYSKYIRRYFSNEECGSHHCKDLGYKEHFHCLDCSFRVFVKKEEMIRHFKWHKKRDDSLQHGFLRFSPMDDCGKKFESCQHNGRQTHYHCIQPHCTKVYISTSDVQMHANYHRKDSAIIQEGFQRFRATEDCGNPSCGFHGQRTTHFHCRRENCSFTFKNKADMEKHKAYHQKDELLAKDGFKKFMKYEHCSFPKCRYSKVSNHIHCIRPGCDYVLHSTGQLYSHKRKHKRRDFERAYQSFKEGKPNPSLASHQKPMINEKFVAMAIGQSMVAAQRPAIKKESEYMDLEDLVRMEKGNSKSRLFDGYVSSEDSLPSVRSEMEAKPKPTDVKPLPTLTKMAIKIEDSKLNSSLNLPIPSEASAEEVMDCSEKEEESDVKNPKKETHGEDEESKRAASPQTGICKVGFVPKVLPAVNEKKERDESWKKYLTRYTANDPCHSRCQFLYKDHYHCIAPECGMLFRSKDGVRDHAKHHEQQDRVTFLSYTKYGEGEACKPNCKYNKGPQHFHCLECNEVISSEDPIFTRLEHHKVHEYTRIACGNNRRPPASLTGTPKIHQENLRRKRGRPPKFPRQEIPLVPKISMTETEIQNEAKLYPSDHPIASGFKKFSAMEACPDERCFYFMKEHFHCVRQRCHHSTDRRDVLTLHARDFHSYVCILDGFEFFDRHINCRRPHCHNNRANRHYHCVRPKCDYSFVRYTTMAQHDKKHRMAEMGLTPSPSIGIPSSAIMGGMASQNGLLPGQARLLPLQPMATPVSQATLMVAASNPSNPIMLALPATTVQTVISKSLTSTSSELISIAPKPTMVATSSANLIPISQIGGTQSGMPLSVLLQQKANSLPQMNWLQMQSKMHFDMVQICGRPFCKLKKKEHFHCFECNQAFSDPGRLKSHITKHGIKLDSSEMTLAGTIVTNSSTSLIPGLTPLSPGGPSTGNEMSEEETGKDELDASSSLNLNPQVFSNLLERAKAQDDSHLENDDDEEAPLVMDLSRNSQEEEVREEASEEEAGVEESSDGVMSEGGPTQRRSRRKRTATRMKEGFVDSDEVVAKIRRVSNSHAQKNGLQDSALQDSLADDSSVDDSHSHTTPGRRSTGTIEGYQKYKYHEDCEYEGCAYRKNLSHYHCLRSDCGYSFCDRARVMQHTERHRRLDAIMGDEFQQFRPKVDCQRPDCEHAKSANHFHCLKCPFICTDSSKVTAHRKHHSKMEEIQAKGFERFSSSEECGRPNCHHSSKQTHYHCTHGTCNMVAMGPSQMHSHNLKHQIGSKK